MARTILGIDFGSNNTSIYKRQVGAVLKEPTRIAVSKNLGETVIVSYGIEAKNMQGKTNDEIEFLSPVLNGIICNFDLAKSLLEHFIEKVTDDYEKFDIVFAVPCGLREEEILDFKNLGLSLGAGKVHLVPSVLTALMGAGMNVNKASGCLSLNLGAGTIDMAICSLNQVLQGYSVFMGGNKIDEAIRLYIQNFYDITISSPVSERLKNEVASLFNHDLSSSEFSGVDMLTKSPKTDIISSSNLKDTVEFYFQKVYSLIKILLNAASPDIVSDISQNGIIVTGGMANLTGLENYLSKRLNLPVQISPDADNAVVIGLGKLIADENYLKKVVSLT